MATFVLIHGAYRGGWCWQRVRRLLQADGHEVFAPSLTGAGERAHLDDGHITLATWIDDVVKLLESEDLREVILVGHSQGGVVITAASEWAAERIAQLVYLDGPVPDDGQTAMEMIPAEIRARFGNQPLPALSQPQPLPPSDEFSEAEAAWINARLTPVPTAPSLEPIRLQNPAALALPRHYFFCRRTPEFYPSSFTRLRFEQTGVPYQWLEAGHDVMLSQPELVVDVLMQIVGELKTTC
jgi:pimeloyl-ACP methyl ester carboxylesterase